MVQMTFELLVETTAGHELGMVKFLRETWGHLYPFAPPPKFRVFYSRSPGPRTEYTATVCLDAHPGTDGPSYALSSGITNQVTDDGIDESVLLPQLCQQALLIP